MICQNINTAGPTVFPGPARTTNVTTLILQIMEDIGVVIDEFDALDALDELAAMVDQSRYR